MVTLWDMSYSIPSHRFEGLSSYQAVTRYSILHISIFTINHEKLTTYEKDGQGHIVEQEVITMLYNRKL